MVREHVAEKPPPGDDQQRRRRGEMWGGFSILFGLMGLAVPVVFSVVGLVLGIVAERMAPRTMAMSWWGVARVGIATSIVTLLNSVVFVLYRT